MTYGNRGPSSHSGLLILGIIVAVVFITVIVGPCNKTDVNDELARTAHQAVQMAHEAQKENDRAYLWPGRMRMLVIAIGVSVPLIAAVALIWLLTRRQQDDLEVIVEAKKYIPLPTSAAQDSGAVDKAEPPVHSHDAPVEELHAP